MVKNFVFGIDCGSTMCKVALIDEKMHIYELYSKPTGWQPGKTALEMIEEIKSKHNIPDNGYKIAATGYGRDIMTFADKKITEITAHAIGGVFLMHNADIIIDIGGQDSKIIKIENGKCASFEMNDKCAAGTGRFLEMALNKLEIPIDEIDNYANGENYADINSMCAVFAESEIIGLIASNTSRVDILNGVISSIAKRIFNMMSKVSPAKNAVVLMTGGLANIKSMVAEIAVTTGRSVHVHENSKYAGAIGASLFQMK